MPCLRRKCDRVEALRNNVRPTNGRKRAFKLSHNGAQRDRQGHKRTVNSASSPDLPQAQTAFFFKSSPLLNALPIHHCSLCRPGFGPSNVYFCHTCEKPGKTTRVFTCVSKRSRARQLPSVHPIDTRHRYVYWNMDVQGIQWNLC